MRCPACQSENREGATFCLRCGERLGRLCGKCGEVSSPAARFCDQCGHNLAEEPDKISIIDYSRPRSYTPKFLAEKILTARKSIEGERKFVTVLFSDVVNYTAMSEKLDPEEVHQIMDGHFKLLIHEIYRYEGIITQFMGDGIMALFGAPLAYEDHAQRACHAALSIRGAIQKYAEKIQRQYGLEFTMRIGINSGLVVVGSIGNDLQMDYTALGDTINLASRMEVMATPGSIFVSRDTYRIARDFFKFKPLGKVTVKGKEEPLEAYELIEMGEVETRIEAAVARGLTKFVGRERELGHLNSAFEQVRSGSGRVIGLVGEAGMGKSRLLLEFLGALDTNYKYLEGRCFHFGSSMAYLPVLDVLRSYLNVKEGVQKEVLKRRVEESITQLGDRHRSLLPSLQELFSLTVEDEAYMKLDPIQKRERTFEAVRDLFVKESQKRPLILAIEDLHWIDKTSEEFLTHLIRWLPNTKILLILLYRPEYAHPWADHGSYSTIRLSEIPAEARGELVESLLQGAQISPRLNDLLLTRAGGNPLFMEELIYALLQSGDIRKGTEGYELKKGAWEIQVPDTVQGIIAARMDRLEENLKRSMQVASVIGRNFTLSILETLPAVKEAVKSHLVDLQRLEFIYEKSRFPEVEYEFKHALVQEVAYNSLLLRRRKEIHKQVGTAIETLCANRVEDFYEMLAYHYSKGEDFEKTYQYMKLSGIKATRNSALWEAFHFYHEAIDTLKKRPAEETKQEFIEICLLMASPMISLGFPEDSLRILQEGERISRKTGSIKSLTTICSIMGLYYSVKGEPQAGAKYGEECLRIAEKAQDIGLMAPIAFDLCSNYAATGQFSKVVDLAPRILSALEQMKGESECFDRGYNIYSALSAFYGLSLGYAGQFEEGKIFCEKALHAALQLQNLYSLGLTEALYGFLSNNRGDGKGALQHFKNSIQYLEKGQIFVLLGLSWSGLGFAHYLLDDFEKARSYVEKGLQLHLDAGISYNLSLHYWMLAMVITELNDLEKAQQYADEALRLAQKNNELYFAGISKIALGRIHARAGAPRGRVLSTEIARAEDLILEGLRLLDVLKIRIYQAVGNLWLGELYGNTGRKEKALEVLKMAQQIFSQTGMDYWSQKTQAVLKSL